jgi:mRNA interferase MazF
MVDQDFPPPRVPPSLKSAPRIRELFWCSFPSDAQLPELWKLRPVIILSMRATLHGAVVVIPCSTSANQDPQKAFPLRTTVDGRAAWAICDKPSTVAVSRLTRPKHGIVRLPPDEFHDMLRIVFAHLPKLPGD